MGQITQMDGGQVRQLLIASNVAAAVAGALTTLLDLEGIAGIEVLGVEVKMSAAAALTAFQVQAKFHPSGDFVTLYSTATHFTEPSGPLIGTSGDLTTLAASGTAWFMLRTLGMWAVRIQATSAGNAGVATVYAGGSGQ